jgi:hypothetical protein
MYGESAVVQANGKHPLVSAQISKIIATLLIAASVFAARSELVTIKTGVGGVSSQWITLSSNEVAEVLSLKLGSGGYLAISIEGSDFIFNTNTEKPLVAGPAIIRLPGTGSSVSFCTLKITRANDLFTPSNAVVIPDDGGAPVQIILESSTDLVTWTASNPGSYGTSSSKRFFRIRATR